MRVAIDTIYNYNIINNYNYIMDNPNVSINDLFAGMKESMAKHNNNNGKNNFLMTKKSKSPCSNGLNSANDARRGRRSPTSKLPLFGSQLKTPLFSSQLKSTDSFGFKTPLFTPSLVSSSLVSSSLIGSSLIGSTSTDSTTPNNEDEDESASIPEYIPLCERRRRQAADDAIRAAHARTDCDVTKFKPFSFQKPSFQWGVKSRDATKLEECSSSILSSSILSSSNKRGKRKSNTDTEDTDTSSSTTTLNSHRMAEEEGLVSSSSIFSYSSQYPHVKKKWSKSEVESLVEFADKWITPDMKRRKT